MILYMILVVRLLKSCHLLRSVTFDGILGLLLPCAVGVAKLNMFHIMGVSAGSNFIRVSRT
jgi:hypothetical protein